eukprot:scaffold87353_cov49-Phaeocystis_antarctica.AAC.1
MPEPSSNRIAWCHPALIAFMIGVSASAGPKRQEGSRLRGGSRRSPGLSLWRPPLAPLSERSYSRRDSVLMKTPAKVFPAGKAAASENTIQVRQPSATFSRDPGPVPSRKRRLLSDPLARTSYGCGRMAPGAPLRPARAR